MPFPFPGNLPDPRIELTSPVLAGRFFTTELPGKPSHVINLSNFCEATPCVSISSSVRWQSFLGHGIVVGTIKLSNNGYVWSMVEYQFFTFPFFSCWNFYLAFATPYPSPLLLAWTRHHLPHISCLNKTLAPKSRLWLVLLFLSPIVRCWSYNLSKLKMSFFTSCSEFCFPDCFFNLLHTFPCQHVIYFSLLASDLPHLQVIRGGDWGFSHD